jgi:hypothetical protein
MAQDPKLQLPSAKWGPIDQGLQRIKDQPGTLLTGDLHQDLKDGRLKAARRYIVLRATDRNGTDLFFLRTRKEEFVSPDRSKAAIFDTVEGARKAARGLLKQFAERLGLSLSFEPQEICEVCERSYWETVTLEERKSDRKWTCHIYKGNPFQQFFQGFFYLHLAELDKHYPAAGQHDDKQAAPSQKPERSQKTERSRTYVLIREIAADLYRNGYDHIEDKPLFKAIAVEAKKSRGVDLDPVRQRATFRRALGRRKDKPRSV